MTVESSKPKPLDGVARHASDVVARQASKVKDRFSSPSHAAARFVAQRWLMRPVVFSITSVTVLGRKNLKGLSGGFVVVANHSSHLDAPLIVSSLPSRLARYLATGAAADYFFDVAWRRGLTSLFFNAFPVSRNGRSTRGRRAVSAQNLLDRGYPVLVFPEGTRSKTGEMGHFKPGAAALAASRQVPCVPLALIGANLAHPRGANWPKAGRHPVGVVFGKPMYAEEGESAIQFTARVRAEVVRLRATHMAEILGRHTPSEGAPQ